MYFDKFYIEDELSSFYTREKKKILQFNLPHPLFFIFSRKMWKQGWVISRHRQSWGDMKALLPFALGIEPKASCMLNKRSTTELWPKF